MRKMKLVMVASMAGLIVLASSVQAGEPPKKEETGKDIAYNRSKGNCLACHAMPSQPDAESAGLYGPPLIAMSARYPSKDKLRAQIWDATATNPDSSMPPFGKHKILTEQEIDKVTDFIYSL
jgi:sulfur-oxidizing protein SoxX